MGLTVAELQARFTGDTRDIDRAQDHVRRDSLHTGSVMKTAFGTAAGFLGANSLTGLVRGIAGVAVKSSMLEQSYSRTMATIAAASGAPQTKLKALDKLVTDLGAKTKFSGNQVADAALELTKAGMSIDDIMGGGLDQTLTLATAGSLDLAEAATIASNAANAFGLKAPQMTRVTTALAGGASASTASVQSLGQALSQVGPGAVNAGLSLEETIATLSAFDQAGIKGSDSGTSLKTMLASLVPQTDASRAAMRKHNLEFVNADGSFKSIATIAEQLHRNLGHLSEAQRTQALTTIFGSDASRAATVLMNQGAKGIRGYIAATHDQTQAQKMADAAMSGTGGAMEKLSGAVETAELQIGKALAPTIEKTANLLADDVVPAVTGFITGMQDGTGAGGDFVDMLKDAYDVAEGVYRVFDSIPGPIKKTGAELLIGAFAVSKLTSGLDLARGGLSGFITDLRSTETRAGAMGRTLRNVSGAGGLLLLQNGLTATDSKVGVLETTLGGFATGLAVGGPIGAGLGTGIGLFYSLKEAIAGTNDVRMPTTKAIGLDDIIEGLDEANGAATQLTTNSIWDFLNGKKGAPKFGSNIDIGTTIRDTARAYGIPDRQLTQAMKGDVAAFEAIKARFDDALKKHPNGFGGVSGPIVEQDAETVINALKRIGGQFEAERSEILHNIAANKEYGHSLDALPDKKQTRVEATGIVPTLGGIAKVAQAIHATPEEIETLIKAAGVKTTVAAVQGVINKTKEFDRQHPVVTPEVDTGPANASLEQLLRPRVIQVRAEYGSGLGVLKPGYGSAGGGGGGNSGGREWSLPSFNRGSSRFPDIGLGNPSALPRVRLTGSHLEILEQRRTLRDLQRQLNERIKDGPRKGQLAAQGIDRKILQAQLLEARKELRRLLSKYVDQDAIDAAQQAKKDAVEALQAANQTALDDIVQRRQGFIDSLTSTQGVFTTGTTSAAQLLKNMTSSTTTDNNWLALLSKLSHAGLSQSLVDQFETEGPSRQAFALANSILANNNLIAQLNQSAAALAKVQGSIGTASATNHYDAMVNIENFNTADMNPQEVAQTLYLLGQVGR